MNDLKSLTTQWFDQVWNQKSAAAIDQLGHPHMTGHGLLSPTDPATGINRFKKYHASLLTTFPDLHITITHLLQENDYTAARLLFTATHTGPNMGPPTNRKITLTALTLIHWQNQKIREAWTEYNHQSLHDQLT